MIRRLGQVGCGYGLALTPAEQRRFIDHIEIGAGIEVQLSCPELTDSSDLAGWLNISSHKLDAEWPCPAACQRAMSCEPSPRNRPLPAYDVIMNSQPGMAGR